MKLDLDKTGGNLIRSFSAGRVLVGDESFSRPVIVTTERIIADWRPPPPEQLALGDLQPVLELQPEVILLGTGSRQRFPTMVVTTAILRQGVGLEVMTTAAACRTYNVLASEYRRVVAALFVD